MGGSCKGRGSMSQGKSRVTSHKSHTQGPSFRLVPAAKGEKASLEQLAPRHTAGTPAVQLAHAAVQLAHAAVQLAAAAVQLAAVAEHHNSHANHLTRPVTRNPLPERAVGSGSPVVRRRHAPRLTEPPHGYHGCRGRAQPTGKSQVTSHGPEGSQKAPSNVISSSSNSGASLGSA